MKILLFIFMISAVQAQEFFYARLTFYSNDPKYSKRSASGKMLVEGESVAAAPNLKFGTKIEIPALKGAVGDGVYEIQDRGSAVSSRKASGGKLPVIDVYVSSKSRIKALAASKRFYKVKVYVR